MHPYIQSLVERKHNAWNEAKHLLDTAEAEKRELTENGKAPVAPAFAC